MARCKEPAVPAQASRACQRQRGPRRPLLPSSSSCSTTAEASMCTSKLFSRSAFFSSSFLFSTLTRKRRRSPPRKWCVLVSVGVCVWSGGDPLWFKPFWLKVILLVWVHHGEEPQMVFEDISRTLGRHFYAHPPSVRWVGEAAQPVNFVNSRKDFKKETKSKDATSAPEGAGLSCAQTQVVVPPLSQITATGRRNGWLPPRSSRSSPKPGRVHQSFGRGREALERIAFAGEEFLHLQGRVDPVSCTSGGATGISFTFPEALESKGLSSGGHARVDSCRVVNLDRKSSGGRVGSPRWGP